MKYKPMISILVASAFLVAMYRNQDFFNQNTDHGNMASDRISHQPSAKEIHAGNKESDDDFNQLQKIKKQDLFEIPGGFHYRSIGQVDYDPVLMESLLQDLENFKKFGSINKGQTDVEFSVTSDLTGR
ncbi:MAG: hypothetical protein R3E94_19915 [Burkholderiaceae bacterium]